MFTPLDEHTDEKHEQCRIIPRSGSTSSSDYGATPPTSLTGPGFLEDKVTETQELMWTKEEEALVLKKMDSYLMSFVLLLTFVLNLDRTNLSNAISDNMAQDLGFDNDGVNFSIMVYSILFALFTLPSNFITKKIGAHIWIPLMMTSWAIVTWCHAFIHDFYGFMIVRIMIAITEAGFIPACLAYLNGFYKTNELGTRLAYFWGAQALASCFSSVMAFGVFRLDGWFGLQGWKWLFLVDGIFTQLIGLIAFMYLPSTPANTSGLLRGSRGWFTEKEQYIAVTRILRDDVIKKDQHKPLTWTDVKLTITDTNLYIHLLLPFVGLMSDVPMKTYLPTVIHSLDFPVTVANLLAAPAVMIGLLFSIMIAKSSDKHGQIVLHGLIGTLWSLVGYILLFFLPSQVDQMVGGKWTYYAIALFTAAAPSWHGMQVAWMASNLAPIGKRTLALGAVIGASNINGVPGSMIYQSKDAPRYYHGNLICICLQMTTLGLWLLQRTRYVFKNKSRQAKWDAMTEDKKQMYIKTTSDVGNQRLDYRFKL